MKIPPFEIKFETSPTIDSYVRGYPMVFLSCAGEASTQEKFLDDLTGGAISRAREHSLRFRGRDGQLLDVSGFPPVGSLGRVVLLGTEKGKSCDDQPGDDQPSDDQPGDNPPRKSEAGASAQSLRHIFAQGARVFTRLHGIGASSCLWIYDGARTKDFLSFASVASEGALGALLSSYRFDEYLTEDEHDERSLKLQRLGISVSGMNYSDDALKAAFRFRSSLTSGIFFARDLVNEPPNALSPPSYAERLCETLGGLAGIKVEVLSDDELSALGFRALLAVARASEHGARVVVIRYEPSDGDKRAPLVFVGKGVTFDSGGLSLKPANSMEDMKMDMGGSAAVVGAMRAIAQGGLQRSCIGIVGLVENMPGGNAQRPGDIVRTLSGKTVEVLNTDAEGRLVLADLLWYAQSEFQPSAVIDLATLTGAMIVALGEEYAGFFANDDRLAKRLESCSKSSQEKIWRLPLDAAYDQLLRSPVADMKNIGGGGAGSITAAQFLQRFIKDGKKEDGKKGDDKKSGDKKVGDKDKQALLSSGSGKTRWAHIDIAGVTWATKARLGRPRGASGFGVRLLYELAASFADED